MLLPCKESYDKTRQHLNKQRHHIFCKGPYSQSHGFSSSHIQMWELDHKESSAERIDAFELRCWRRLLRVPWTARRSNKSILKNINPEYSLEGLRLKLKLHCFGHLIKELTHWKRYRCWERLRTGEVVDRAWDWWMASQTQSTWVWANTRR